MGDEYQKLLWTKIGNLCLKNKDSWLSSGTNWSYCRLNTENFSKSLLKIYYVFSSRADGPSVGRADVDHADILYHTIDNATLTAQTLIKGSRRSGIFDEAFTLKV